MSVVLQRASNRGLDRLARVEVQLGTRRISSFHLCGLAGLVLASSLAMTLSAYRDLSLWVMGGITGFNLSIFFGLAMSTKILTGRESLTFYHHQLAILGATAVLLRLLHQPWLSYLDITMIGLLAFLSCGRIGCLMAGCCHGRPHRWGVCYQDAHVVAGFPPYLAGVRLFPVQVFESLWAACLATAGSILILYGRLPGEVFTLSVIAYSSMRFFLEFLRGDPERPYWWDFSEAQWTSLLLCGAVGLAGLAGLLPLHRWLLVPAAGLPLTVLLITLHRRWTKSRLHLVLHARHLREFAESLGWICSLANDEAGGTWKPPAASAIPTRETSLGIRVSTTCLPGESGLSYHYALSSKDGEMEPGYARVLAQLILLLKHPGGSGRLIQGKQGVIHLVVKSYPPHPNAYPLRAVHPGALPQHPGRSRPADPG